MSISIPKEITAIARGLRKNMTLSEKILWKHLRYDKVGCRFLRQKPIYVYTENSGLDRFVIPDFYNHDKKIIIEVDGSIHDIPEIKRLDKIKEALLEKQGIKIFRVTNQEIMYDIENVIERIKNQIS